MRLYRKMDWTTKLAQKGIKVLHKDKEHLVLQTTNLIDTLFYVQTFGWHIDNIQADDITKDGKTIERNILYYYK